MDLTAVEVTREWDVLTCNTGIAVEIPEGHVGLIYPRSSIYKTGLELCNSVGVIDSGYRGELILKFRISAPTYKGVTLTPYDVGDRVGQLIIVPYPQVEFEEVEDLSSAERGEGGFGSTGS